MEHKAGLMVSDSPALPSTSWVAAGNLPLWIKLRLVVSTARLIILYSELKSSTPKDMSTLQFPEPINGTLFEKGIFADIIKFTNLEITLGYPGGP